MRRLVSCALVAAVWATAPAAAATAQPSAPTDTSLANAVPRIRALIKSQKHDPAAVEARTVIAAARPASRADSLLLADAIDLLVEAMQSLGHWKLPEVEHSGLRAITIRERALGSNHPGVAPSLRRLAQVLFMGGERRRAVAMIERTLQIQEPALAPENVELLRSLNIYGQMLADLGEYEGARATIERVRVAMERQRGPRAPTVANCLHSLANLAMRTGDYEEALGHVHAALAIQTDSLPPSHPEITRSLTTLGSIEYYRGDYAASRRAHLRAQQLREQASGPDHPEVATSIRLAAQAQEKLGDLVGARRQYELALAILETRLGPEHQRVAEMLGHLASVMDKMGYKAQALALYQRELAIKEKVSGSDDREVAFTVLDVGRMMLDAGRLAAADSMITRAVAIRERRLGASHPDYARAIGHLAMVRHRLGREREAAAFHEQSVAILRGSASEGHPWLAEALAELAAFRRQTGDTSKALNAALEAERIGRDHFRLLARSLSEREALLFAGSRPVGLDEALDLAAAGSVAASDLATVWDAVIRSRGLVMEEMAERRQATTRVADPDVALLDSLLAGERSRYARLLVRGAEGDSLASYRRRLAAARERMEAAEREFAERSQRLGREPVRSAVGFEEVVAALPPSTALVAYARYARPLAGGSTGHGGGTAYLALVLPRNGLPVEVVPLGPSAPIDSLVRDWRQQVLAALAPGRRSPLEMEATCRQAGESLRRRTWDPLAERLGDAKQVLVVPDGLLNLVNLAALPAADGSYLAERRTRLLRLTAERDLLRGSSARSGRDGLLAFGGPDFDASPFEVRAPLEPLAALEGGVGGPAVRPFRGTRTECEDFRQVRFAPLPAAAQEARDVVERWRAFRAKDATTTAAVELTGAAASEGAFKREAPRGGDLHVGTHGFFLGGACAERPRTTRGVGTMAPAIEAAPQNGAIGEGNPLRLSGLALAGANRREGAGPDQEDGVITAEEIAALDLDGVECAVLSGCDTGVGEVAAGEGVLGLQRAFRIAGVRTLVMSLWAVEDRAARRWMEAFYRSRVERGRGAAEATRDASLEVLRERRAAGLDTHPFHWAAFVASGDWR